MLACHCLNVIIETQEDDFQMVTAEILGLSQEEMEDSFFKQDIRQVRKLININKSHSGLIQTRNVGCWVVHYCINCAVHSHAVHREKGASCVLVNSNLLSDKSIEDLRSRDDKYSHFYKIIVNSRNIVEEDTIETSYLPSEVENVLRGLKHIATEIIKKESQAVEERIKQFADEQYNKLSDLRDRAFREQQALTRIIINNTVNKSNKPASTNLSMSNPQGMPSRLNEPLAAGSVKSTSNQKSATNLPRHTPKKQKSCPGVHVTSFDSEGLFEFEGVDDVRSAEASEIEESDIDDHEIEREDLGVNIPRRQKAGGTPVAKSLPMTIPPFTSRNRDRGFEDVDDLDPVETTLDIAASIKALAKSVHGDTVFGDLPKPRYTYI